MAAPIDPAIWAEIRRHWEHDPDAPSLTEAGARAASVHGFTAPTRTSIHRKCKAQGWKRQGTMAGVSVAAQRLADTWSDGHATKKTIESARAAQLSFQESVDVRAAITVRHREEWDIVGTLMGEALKKRATDLVAAFNIAKHAKITAETLALKQAGERRAWGMDILDSIGGLTSEVMGKMTDAQLEVIAAGKSFG